MGLKALMTLTFILGMFSPIDSFESKPCASHAMCERQRTYCFQPVPLVMGKCLPCWTCCSFRAYFQTCPDTCLCEQPFHYQIENKGQSPLAFYETYALYEIYNASLISSFTYEITKPMVLVWLAKESIPTDVAFMLANMLAFSEATSVSLPTFAHSLHQLHRENLLCGSNQTNSSVGCPCAPYSSNYMLFPHTCEAGTRCSRAAYTGLTSSVFTDPLGYVLGAVCVPCQLGEYCPRATLSALKCPKGYHCPNPTTKIECSPGSFCTSGSIAPLSCNYTHLLTTVKDIPIEPQPVIVRLMKHGDPYTGNICPLKSSAPSTKCSPGFFCPSPSAMIECPKGHFCKEQVTAPSQCPALSVCPAGSSQPRFTGIPILFVSFFTLCAFCVRYIPHIITRIRSSQSNTSITVKVQDPIIFVDETPLRSYYDPTVHVRALTRHLNVPAPTVTKCFHVKALERIALINVSASIAADKDPWLWPNSVVFAPKKLNVIIGGSGCGKSTLLDLLRGTIRNGHLTGRVEIKRENEPNVTLDLQKMESLRQWKSLHKLKGMRGHVPQDDVLYPDLTVEENILFSAFLKLSSHKNVAREHTEYTLTNLGLFPLRNKVVGSIECRGISGGQRKRVNVGMEIVHMPSLLIMDEPTSGLDASGCQSLVEFCKYLSNETLITIIAVIHQPRYASFVLFDNVTLLSKYGTIFEGHPTSSLVYFNQGLDLAIDKNENPADVLMDILSGKKGMSQHDLVNVWRTKGHSWMDQCTAAYPMLPLALQCSIIFDTNTRTVLERLMDGTQSITAQKLKKMFQLLGIYVHQHTCEDFIAYHAQKANPSKSLPKKEILRIFHEECSSVYCNAGYDNITDRIALFTNTPRSIRQKYTEAAITHHITLAYKFITRLKKRSGITHTQSPSSTLTSKSMTCEILLASMTCKCISDNQAPPSQYHMRGLQMPHLPGALKKIYIILFRKLTTIWRSAWHIQFVVPIAAAFIVGLIQGADTPLHTYPNNAVHAMVTLGVLSVITHIRTFSLDKVIICRETDAKINILPFFIAYNIADILWITLLPLTFTIPYYFFILPSTSYSTYYIVALMVCWWASGAAYVISSLPFGQQWANLVGVFVALIQGAFLQGLNPTIAESKGTFQGILIHTSFNRWAMEILTIREYTYFDKTQPNIVWTTIDKIGMCGMTHDVDTSITEALRWTEATVTDRCEKYVSTAYIWLFGLGAAFRIIAFIVMWWTTHPILQRFQWMVRTRVFTWPFKRLSFE